MAKVLIISSDCHAGALPKTYNEYMPKRFHEAADAWWLAYAREMVSRAGTFFDQEAVEAWGSKKGLANSGDLFNALAERDEAYRVIVSHIHSIHPARADRRIAIDLLLDLVHSATPPETERVERLLGRIARLVHASRYGKTRGM